MIVSDLSKYEKKLFNIKMHTLTIKETVDFILTNISNNQSITHCVVNVAKVVQAQKNTQLRSAINFCDLVNIDGMGIVLAARFLGIPVPERVTGIELMQGLMRSAAIHNLRVFILGAKHEILVRAIGNIKLKNPDLQICGFHHGYFKDQEEEVVEMIKLARPDMLFVALSSPQKENFIKKYQPEMQIPFIMGVGGSIDVLAGVVRRAPPWMQAAGLEWLYRLYQEPRRMWKRYLTSNTIFLGMLIKAKLNYFIMKLRTVNPENKQ